VRRGHVSRSETATGCRVFPGEDRQAKAKYCVVILIVFGVSGAGKTLVEEIKMKLGQGKTAS
jgi:hypothetical protein